MLFTITLIVFTSGCTHVEYKEVNPFVKVDGKGKEEKIFNYVVEDV